VLLIDQPAQLRIETLPCFLEVLPSFIEQPVLLVEQLPALRRARPGRR
jgi:hypothetical protein